MTKVAIFVVFALGFTAAHAQCETIAGEWQAFIGAGVACNDGYTERFSLVHTVNVMQLDCKIRYFDAFANRHQKGRIDGTTIKIRKPKVHKRILRKLGLKKARVNGLGNIGPGQVNIRISDLVKGKRRTCAIVSNMPLLPLPQ